MTLSPSAQKICAVAVEHFADFGYDASSLAAIAEQAGMRKASLYAHFAAKDALFGAVMSIAMDEERSAANRAFASEPDAPLPGGAHLHALKDRYTVSPHFRFLIRTVYAPPVALRDEIIAQYRAFEADLRSLFVQALPDGLNQQRATMLAEAYLGIVDSLQVELIYNSAESYQSRFDALWGLLRQHQDS